MNNDSSNLYDQNLNFLQEKLIKKTNRIFILTDNLGNMNNIQKYQQKS